MSSPDKPEVNGMNGKSHTADPGSATDSVEASSQEAGSEKEKKALIDTNGEKPIDKEHESKQDVDFIGNEKAPIDKWKIVYLILLLHGIGTLTPWNMFITAKSYFEDYKLVGNTTGNFTDPEAEVYRSYFLSFLGFTAQIPNVILNAFNLFCQCGGGGNIVKRITWSIIIVVFFFVLTVALAMVDSTTWPGPFFWITMVTVVIINMANGVYQNSVFGTAACLPMKYTNAVVLGSNISGTLTALLNILSIAGSPNLRVSAIYYFLAAIFILLFAFDTYYLLPLMPFFRHHQELSERDRVAAVQNEGESEGRPPFWLIFKQGYKQFLSVFLVFFVTLTCFPAIQASVARSDENFFIPQKYFMGITCFLFFNAFAMFGNLFSEFVKFPGPRWVWIPVVLRLLFIPFFMFCNSRPDTRSIPVLISNDYGYIVGGIVMAFTSGYYSSLAMMYAPASVQPRHAPVAGMMGAFFLISGIFGGVLFSLPVTIFMDKIGS